FFIIAVQTPGSGISFLLAVGTPSTGSGNLYCQWELSPGSGNALCILFPTYSISTSIGYGFTVNGKNTHELKRKFLDDLHNNAFSGTNGKDAVEHIEYYLKIIDPTDYPIFFIIAVQTPGSGISFLLAVGTPSTGSGNLYYQWELSPGSGNALCILFPTRINVFNSFALSYSSARLPSDTPPPQYTVNHPIFNARNDLLSSRTTLMEQMEQLTSMCEMVCQIIQKKQEEKKIKEEQAANARYWKIPSCCDDDDDYNSAIIPNEPFNPLSMGDEHLDTIPATKSDKFIKSSVENLVPNPSESEGENGCDMLACFTTFSNDLFDADYEFDSVDDQSLSDEDVPEKIFSNPLFDEEIISMKIDQHHFNAESDLIESLLNHDSSIIPSSSKIDSLLDEFAGKLTLLKSIPPGIDETDYHPKNEIRLIERLLYDNSFPRPPKEFVFENSNAEIESFSPSPIPHEDSDSFMEEIDLSFNLDDPMSPSIEDDDYDSERDILILNELPSNYSLLLPENESFHFDILSFSRPPAKPPDGNTGILNIKMMGDISK
nr:hypothetical protein [Tanacetum cinerariifolium]